MTHASPEEVHQVELDVATRDVLELNTPGERAMYLFHILQRKRSAIVRAGVIDQQGFKRALDAYHNNRLIGVVGRPSFLHPITEQRLTTEIRRAQESGQAYSKDDVRNWVSISLSLLCLFYLS
jgi:hypothetical protein